MPAELDKCARDANDAIYKALTTNLNPLIVDAVNNWVRSQMRLPFTGMPRRGILRQIMSAIDVRTKEEWLARGVREEDLVAVVIDDPVLYSPWYETGLLCYEVMERRLERQDYERRLVERRVSRSEWHWRNGVGRRPDPEGNAARSRRAEDMVYSTLGNIVGQIRSLQTKKSPGE